MDFGDVVRARRMTRSFTAEPVDGRTFVECVSLASRSPSAGKSQGWNLIVLDGEETSRYWDVALPADRRRGFAFPSLLGAPLLAIVLADKDAYLRRYSEPDKQGTGLGADENAWPAPFWTIDAAFATMTLMLALESAGLGSLFFAHASEAAVREEFSIPPRIDILGVLAVGHPDREATRRGRSAGRALRSAAEIIHPGRW